MDEGPTANLFLYGTGPSTFLTTGILAGRLQHEDRLKTCPTQRAVVH